MYKVAYWIGSPLTRGNGTYKTTGVMPFEKAKFVRDYYVECGYLSELMSADLNSLVE